MFYIASDFTFTMRQNHTWTSFPLWLSLFILSGGTILPFPSSILDTYQPGELIFHCHNFCLFIVFMGFLRKEYWSNFQFPSPVDHILSKLYTKTRPSWVILQGMAHSFIDLHKAVIHEIILVTFLWLWFSFWRLWDCSSCFFWRWQSRRTWALLLLPVSFWRSPAGACISNVLQQGQGDWQQQSWEVHAGMSSFEDCF